MEKLLIYSILSPIAEHNKNDPLKQPTTKDRNFSCLVSVALCYSDKPQARYCHMQQHNEVEYYYCNLFLCLIECLLAIRRKYRFDGFSVLSSKDFF